MAFHNMKNEELRPDRPGRFTRDSKKRIRITAPGISISIEPEELAWLKRTIVWVFWMLGAGGFALIGRALHSYLK